MSNVYLPFWLENEFIEIKMPFLIDGIDDRHMHIPRAPGMPQFENFPLTKYMYLIFFFFTFVKNYCRIVIFICYT